MAQKSVYYDYLLKFAIVPTNKSVFDSISDKYTQSSQPGVNFSYRSYKEKDLLFKNNFWILNPDVEQSDFFYNGHIALIVSDDFKNEQEEIKKIAFRLKNCDIGLINAAGLYEPSLSENMCNLLDLMRIKDNGDFLFELVEGEEVFAQINPYLQVFYKHPLINDETMINKVIGFNNMSFDDALKELSLDFINKELVEEMY